MNIKQDKMLGIILIMRKAKFNDNIEDFTNDALNSSRPNIFFIGGMN